MCIRNWPWGQQKGGGEKLKKGSLCKSQAVPFFMSRNSPRRKRRKKLQLFSNGPPCSKSNSLFQFILEIGEFRLFGWKNGRAVEAILPKSPLFSLLHCPLLPLAHLGPIVYFFWGGEGKRDLLRQKEERKGAEKTLGIARPFLGFYYYSRAKNFGGKGGNIFIFTSRNLSKCTKGNLEEKKGPNSNSEDPFSCILSLSEAVVGEGEIWA